MGQGARNVLISFDIAPNFTRPKNAKELYNLRRSSLRNAIERIFGVMKKRFRVLTSQLEYSYEIQVRLVKVICCLHNIIRISGGDDLFDEMWIQNSEESGDLTGNHSPTGDVVAYKAVTAAETRHANSLRDTIADKMWTQYCRYKRQNRLI
jgi:hypothetical protein